MSLLLRDIAYYICSCSCSYSSSAVVVVAVVVVVVVYLSAYLYLYICLSVYLQAWKGSYSARLPHSFNLTTLWQRQQRNSSRLPECFNLTMSKTKLFCETSSIFEVPQFLKLTTSKTKQFCETSFKNGKLRAELTASYQCVLQFFHSICVKYCACHEKVMPGHTKCCTGHAKSS